MRCGVAIEGHVAGAHEGSGRPSLGRGSCSGCASTIRWSRILFAAALPRGIDILSQPDLVARSLGAYLERHPAFDAGGEQHEIRFLTSGDAEQAGRFASVYFGREARFETLGDE